MSSMHNRDPDAEWFSCWFCRERTDGSRESYFSAEFDAYYHQQCAEDRGVGNAEDPVLEAELRAYEAHSR